MENIEKFKKTNNKPKCSVCGSSEGFYFPIEMKIIDPTKKFKNTNKPTITTYNFIFCEDCFREFIRRTDDLLGENPKTPKMGSLKSYTFNDI